MFVAERTLAIGAGQPHGRASKLEASRPPMTYPAAPRVTCMEWLAFGVLLLSYVLFVVLVIGAVILAIRALNVVSSSCRGAIRGGQESPRTSGT